MGQCAHCSYIRVGKSHTPTAAGLAAARRTAQAKVRLVAAALRLAGRRKEADILEKSFEAFNVQNTLAYNRSIVCDVANVRELQVCGAAAHRAAAAPPYIQHARPILQIQ
jgi:hypothetical protein